MPAIVKGKKLQLTDDLAQAKRLKPKLRKFVIDSQVQQAATTAHETKSEQDALLTSDDIINRASNLACIAFYVKSFWKEYPPAVEMKWLTAGWSTPDLQREMHTDIAGLATYLVREYRTYLREHKTAKRGYPNPLSDDNLLFFWQKFNADLRLLIDAGRRRIALGNAGVVIVDGKGRN